MPLELVQPLRVTRMYFPDRVASRGSHHWPLQLPAHGLSLSHHCPHQKDRHLPASHSFWMPQFHLVWDSGSVGRGT